MQKISGEIAIRTKIPKHKGDYKIFIISKGQIKENDFESIFHQYSVANLECNNNDSARQLPWYSCGKFDNYLSAIRYECTNEKDAQNRLISAACCLCVPLKDVLSNKIAFEPIVTQIPSLTIYDQKLKENYDISPDSKKFIDNSKSAIEEMGFEFAAYIASLLIIKPIAIIGGSELTPDKRLRCLDSILSLLPFGARINMSISTWAESCVDHSIKLCFTNSVKKEQIKVDWKETNGDLLGKYQIPFYYYSNLVRLKKMIGIPFILRTLLELNKPIEFGNHEHIKKLLVCLSTPIEIFQRLLNGEKKISDIVYLLDKFSKNELQNGILSISNGKIKEFLITLLRQNNNEQIDILAKHWNEDIWQEVDRSIQNALQNSSGNEQAKVLSFLRDLSQRVNKLGEFINLIIKYSISLQQRNQQIPDTAIEILIKNYIDISEDNWKTIANNIQFLCEYLAHIVEEYSSDMEAGISILKNFENIDISVQYTSAFRICLGSYDKSEDISDTTLDLLAEVDIEYIFLLIKKTKIKDKLIKSVICWLPHYFSKNYTENWDKWDTVIEDAAKINDISTEIKAKIDILRLGLKKDYRQLFLYSMLNSEIGNFEKYVNELVFNLNKLQLKKVEFVKTIFRAAAANEISNDNQESVQNRIFLFLNLWSSYSVGPYTKYSLNVTKSLYDTNFNGNAVLQFLIQFEKLYPLFEFKEKLKSRPTETNPLDHAADLFAKEMSEKFKSKDSLITIFQLFNITIQTLYTKKDLNTLSDLSNFLLQIKDKLNNYITTKEDKIVIEKACIDYFFSADKSNYFNILS